MVNQLSAIQMLSVADADINITRIKKLLTELDPYKNQLILLPENAISFTDRAGYFNVSEELGKGYYQQQLADLSKQYECYLICGSFPIKSKQPDKIFTTMLVFSPQGKLISHYHKIHLFDALVGDEKGSYRESDTFIPGQDYVLFDWQCDDYRSVKVGLAICYDLRFPGLFQRLRAEGAEVLLLPAAFTHKTGEAHWQPLLQARAIENQCYVVAVNQGGKHESGRETFGHSMIISPWGEILSQLKYGEGNVQAKYDQTRIDQIRQAMPIALHNRFYSDLAP
ncbi:carbon-nitrogen hydrolase family protein [Psychromonas sp. PT13]|uniref:carbon-nitrogen hydrolase family protein n=1 Tax=Psychromonas sp. PT13 TaxID=3439547 RepID=UPI003EBBDFBD